MLIHPTLVSGRRFAPFLCLALCAAQAGAQGDSYAKRYQVHGIPILATEAVADDYLYMTAAVYDHMTSRQAPFDMRELHRQSGFRILLIDDEESFLDLPEYEGQEEDLDEAGGLGGSIGEFHIAVRVGSPHTLVHELGHGIYHSAIQFKETGGATDEEAWYRSRVRALYEMDLEAAREAHGEDAIHEVLLARAGGFSAKLASAWKQATHERLWEDEYAGTEPNEYWAEGVAHWFRAAEPWLGDPRERLRVRDPQLHALCQSIFPETKWTPATAAVTGPHAVRWSDDEEEDALPALMPGSNSPSVFELCFDFLDRDRDGYVEAYEGAEAWLYLTTEADKDKSGSLQLTEIDRWLLDSHRSDLAERASIFEEFDHNQDGALSRSEIPEEVRDVVMTHDQDRDDRVSLDELLQAKDLFDPVLGFEQELLTFLAEVDHDGNDAFRLDDLPAEDRGNFAEQFSALDRDEDGSVTRVELMALLDEERSGAKFELQGDRAVMSGVIGPSTPGRVLRLVLQSPQVRTLVMRDVPGSLDDESNLRAARYVRQMGLNTLVPAGGEVASGGTDFFLAGVNRSWNPGAKFGVHSWGGFGEEGANIPKGDPEHQKYLDYYAEMNIPERFYWFTLEAASAEDIHWMSDAELARFGFGTTPEKE